MKIAILGIRGIPASYGGFETLAEELAPRLVDRGHDVTVYGRSNIIRHKGEYYKGVRLRILPTISHKYLDTIAHTFLSILDSFFRDYEIILICNAANSIFAFIPRITGKKVVVNVDGIERKRKKWSFFGKLWYLFGEFFSVLFPNKFVSDARVIQDYYKERYGTDSVLIPYGAYTQKVDSTQVLMKFGLKPKEYYLYVSRLEPENNAQLVIKAFEQVKTEKKLVIVGDAPYAKKYIESLKKTKDPRIIFTGFVFGLGYKEFQSHAYSYIHATEVGGTHPALIEAMGFGNCVIVNGAPENIETLGDTGIIYKMNDRDDLRKKIEYVEGHPEVISEMGQRAREKVERECGWDKIAGDYERLFKELLRL
jgi:glycosyltransferase involved in cell wall biosynthesis